jgi:hypothetical protein
MKPEFRKLKGYAFDPSLSLQIATVGINNIIYKVPWEKDLDPGPIGEYVEVIDYDPTLKCFYLPVNLSLPDLLVNEGVEPSESDPKFHQQMVYAVAMTTIDNFEKSLGRKVLWAPHVTTVDKHGNPGITYNYVQRLRIYPHAFRKPNAYYSPHKKALLFGYFEAKPADIKLQMPGSVVFTCLSHDVIAHETAHAILDGIYNKYSQPTNVDVLAFHEAFSDIIALFQHFTFPEVLKSQIRRTRGDLASQNLLGQLAQEFGTSIGHYGALRDAIGHLNSKTGEWEPTKPTGDEYSIIFEPHKRGSILVSAVFEAFLSIYKSRVADLIRIASGGSGILPQGEIHPDLVNRLAGEASKTAQHVLTMCIRALDYCPPVDITFGDFFRAIITADYDLITDDSKDYRVCFIEAFRKRGIYPKGLTTLSVDSLRYSVDGYSRAVQNQFELLTDFMREFRSAIMYKQDRQEIFDITQDFIGGSRGLHNKLQLKFHASTEFEALTGLAFNEDVEQQLGVRIRNGKPTFEVHSLRLASRVGPEGKQSNQMIISLIQRAKVKVFKLNENERKTDMEDYVVTPIPYEFENKDAVILRGGCTLIFDLDTVQLKYAISKPILDVKSIKKENSKYKINKELAISTYEYLKGSTGYRSDHAAYFMPDDDNINEPFFFLHHH